MTATTTVIDNLSASGASEHATRCNAARAAILALYGERVADDRTRTLKLGADVASLIDLNLSIAKDEAAAKDHRAQTTQYVADRIAETYGDSVSPDEWVAIHHLVTLSRELTASIDSVRISVRFLRVARAWITRTILPAESGFREVWDVRAGYVEALRSLIDDQAKTPRNTASLRELMTATDVAVEQSRIDAMDDAKAQAKAQKKLDAKSTPKEQTTDLPAPADWTSRDATLIAAMLISADNRPAAEALCRMLAPYLMTPAAAPTIAPETTTPATAESQSRKAA